MDENIGRKAYKKCGYYGGLVGVVRECDAGITDYTIYIENIGAVGANLRDIVFVDEMEAK
ncbi:hypothetical protein [Aneurinibacillus migulanus]|uniref:hypothetical protein n=1 Tax=Aneurinibacillus migulanus TaxID=47500 RepID=UPI0020A01D66|nr:hypothetical protein [Aneurinibacillus migulanus]MCP1354606.1 hypothetical protein [Aneurinibacillus migulanus]